MALTQGLSIALLRGSQALGVFPYLASGLDFCFRSRTRFGSAPPHLNGLRTRLFERNE